MSERQSSERVERLLAGSLAVWGLGGKVILAVEGGEVRLSGPEGELARVSQGGRGWRVAAAGAVSEHAGVPGMLRALRRALAPEQQPGRMIVAPPPRDD